MAFAFAFCSVQRNCDSTCQHVTDERQNSGSTFNIQHATDELLTCKFDAVQQMSFQQITSLTHEIGLAVIDRQANLTCHTQFVDRQLQQPCGG